MLFSEQPIGTSITRWQLGTEGLSSRHPNMVDEIDEPKAQKRLFLCATKGLRTHFLNTPYRNVVHVLVEVRFTNKGP